MAVQLITMIISVASLVIASTLYILQRREIEWEDQTEDNEDFWDEVFLRDSDEKMTLGRRLKSTENTI